MHTVLGAGSWNWKLRVLEPPFRITGTCGEGPGAAAQAQKVLQKGGRGGCQDTAITYGEGSRVSLTFLQESSKHLRAIF